MDDQNAMVTTEQANEVLVSTNTETSTPVKGGIEVLKAVGVYALVGAAAAGGATLAARGASRFCDWLEVKAEGRKAKKEAEKAAREKQKEQKKEPEVETSKEAKEILNNNEE